MNLEEIAEAWALCTIALNRLCFCSICYQWKKWKYQILTRLQFWSIPARWEGVQLSTPFLSLPLCLQRVKLGCLLLDEARGSQKIVGENRIRVGKEWKGEVFWAHSNLIWGASCVKSQLVLEWGLQTWTGLREELKMIRELEKCSSVEGVKGLASLGGKGKRDRKVKA